MIPSLAVVLLAFAGACGEAEAPGPGSTSRAVAERGLAPDWALLSVPADGGRARLHPLRAPGRELWSSAVELPPADEVVRLAPRLIALRGPGGAVYRYDPAEDAVSRVAALGGEASWEGGDDGGVWLAGGDERERTLLRLSADGADRRSAGGGVRWAGPAAGGATVALVDSGPAALVRWPPDASEPDARLELPVGPPAVVTAWDRVAVLTRTGREGVLQVVSLEEMAARGRVEVGGPVTALAASASSHQIYAGVAEPPRVVAVGRVSGEVRTLARVGSPPREIRPGVAGGPPLVRDGRAIHLIPWGGDGPVRVPGEWRGDLPLSLPDGSVLTVRDGAVSRWAPGESSAGPPPSGSADRLWVPVRWREEAGARGGAEAPAAAGREEGGARQAARVLRREHSVDGRVREVRPGAAGEGAGR